MSASRTYTSTEQSRLDHVSPRPHPGVHTVSYPGRTPTKPPLNAPTLTNPGTPVLASPAVALSAQAFAVSVLDRHESELVDEAMRAVASRSAADAAILQGLINELKAQSELL